MFLNEIYNYKILELIMNNKCDLSNLLLTKLDDNLFNFSNLIELNLCENKLSYINEDIKNLTNLKTLNLSDNILIELPKTIGDLTNVENLFLSGNNLKKLPKNIVNLKNLKWLSLLDNKDLILEEEQKKWIQSLQNNGCKVFLEK
ncbi:MAG: hypothetical protein KA157_06220 [Aliarcobacter sp.]|jgi:Leucine-rich repeat (LRR) protein|nr:hypothetical protein [Aliarcobacter sp.]